MGKPALDTGRLSTVSQGLWAMVVTVLLSAVMYSVAYAAPSPSTPALISPQNDLWQQTRTATFNWSKTSRTASYELRYAKTTTCDVDSNNSGQLTAQDAVMVPTTEPFKYIEGLTDGIWCWQVRSVSYSGKQGSWSEARVLKIDATAPVISVRYPFIPPKILGTVDASTVSMTLILDGVHRSDIQVAITPKSDPSGVKDWVVTLPDLSKGEHTYAVSAVDGAGNTSTTEQTTLTTKDLAATEAAIVLPLMPTTPLVFVAPTQTADTRSPVSVNDSHKGGNASAKLLVENGAHHHASSESPGALQASREGWRVFGVAWYWWALSGGMSFWTWAMVSRARLSARLSWIGTV